VPSAPPRAVLFDLDGTIMDSRPGIVAGMANALAAVGIEVAEDHDWGPYLGPPLREIFTTKHGMTPTQVDVAVAAYLDHYEAGGGMYDNAVYPGMADLLSRLRAEDRVVAVATSKRAFLAEAILGHFELRPFVAHVGGAARDGTGGRKHEVITATLAALDVPPGPDVVMVGDRHHDIDGGTMLGVSTIGVEWGYGEPGELAAAGADRIVATTAELAAALGVDLVPT
jgi:phosphoglycolate phosphatase